ncbi:DNA-binding domain-containing protein [Pseudorhodobacter sp.]|uniref:HvfC/BufC N-terminal domain-containing protein n=1 Tax=Pseudorhodobacter sp. TaxID=1934400 RepID=UPI0026479952|nr:DNA-binding domain-containing protein [Pseudorhodobacter sp.]MDN5787016.1 putative DNA-binding domain-containing protein [Pseudorhodobacter sp.]
MSQSGFVMALLDPDLPVPDGLIDGAGRPAGRRFSVYRNNVVGSLTEVLEKGFPVLQKLLGAEYFAALAKVFLRSHPPETRVMMLYGAQMPAFLAGFEPLAHLPYLPDVARLEQALRESYHSADSIAVAATDLAALSPEDFISARLQLAPTLRMIRSQWPISSIWAANTKETAPKPVMRAEDTLILRAEFDPEPHELGQGAADFIAALLRDETVGTAMDSAGSDFDLGATLSLLIAGNAVTTITRPEYAQA